MREAKRKAVRWRIEEATFTASWIFLKTAIAFSSNDLSPVWRESVENSI